MKEILGNIEEQMRQIDWFANCGDLNLNTDSLNFSYLQIQTVEEAVNLLNSSLWESAALEAANRLSVYLHLYHNNEYQKWNDVAHFATTSFENIRTSLVDKSRSYNLPEDVVIDLKGNYIHTFIELYFERVSVRTPKFYTYLKSIYELGKIPCGWGGLPLEEKGCVPIDVLSNKILIF